ncbi:C6 finger domain protein [Penicillium brevicompactum]|uniref:C6 finger domain protein n=1 Tax=Penicillium brevicompactum TaxID=5074 RepID=UPI0025419B0C|nr:C6 finger domain protein [Penicillium brevicompactum]KAJ5332368.1 C6 finger domain protein [Penicillium brevicompactum]
MSHDPSQSPGGASAPSANPSIRPRNRISHTKSRGGCYTCKRRRIKCDEQKPVCGSCSVRGGECIFPDPGSTKNKPRRPASHNLNATTPSSDPGQCDLPIQRGGQYAGISPLSFNLGPAGASNDEGRPDGHLNMTDLNLLQHFILHTSKKMTLNPAKTLVWERVFPEIAGANEFLMHLLLALAGLDILTEQSHDSSNSIEQRTSPDHLSKSLQLDRLRVVVEHHQLGLKGLKEKLWSVNESNAEILMTGSMLIVGFAFASLRFGDTNFPQPSSSSPGSLDLSNAGKPQTHWLRLVGGVASITRNHWMTVKTGRCRALLNFGNSHEDWKLCRSELDGTVPMELGAKISKFASGGGKAVSDLRTLIHALIASVEQTFPNSEQSHTLKEQLHALTIFEETYMRVLYALRLQRFESRPSSNIDVQAEIEEAAVTSWPSFISQGFISSLEFHGHFGVIEGVSFTILAHLYLTLAILKDTWYLGATFDAEIGKINTLISGLRDERLVRLMEWPMAVAQTP